MKLKNILFPLIIILMGILFSVYLQGQISEGVYFSGDAGLKALLSQQLATEDLRFDLIPPSETWVRELWQNGLYPYEEPFVYHVADKYYITFPYTFPLVTAPFYRLFGYRGLYLVPLFSLWIVWSDLLVLCRSFKLNKYLTSVALIILIFASYLTFYSATYWEHTLAVALCFSGLTLLLVNREKKKLSVFTALFSGFLLGFAVWFRPEFICVVGLVSGLVLLTWIGQLELFSFLKKVIDLKPISFLNNQKVILLLSTWLTVATFFLTNKLIYNHALGIHAIQIVEKSSSLMERFSTAWENMQGMSIALLVYFPILYFSLLYLVIYLIQKIRFTSNNKIVAITYAITLILVLAGFFAIANESFNLRDLFKQCLIFFPVTLISLFSLKDTRLKFNLQLTFTYLACLFFLIGVSILVPVGTAGLIAGGKQWGPRFLLILVPVISLVTAIELDYISKRNKTIGKYWFYFLLTFLIIIGIEQNILQGTEFLQRNTRNIEPAVNFLKQDNNQIVAISHQFVGQALELSTTRDKIFFKVENGQDLIKLSKTLIEQQQPQFTYICYPNRFCNLPHIEPSNLRFTQGDRQYQIKINKLGRFGKYPIYEIAIDDF